MDRAKLGIQLKKRREAAKISTYQMEGKGVRFQELKKIETGSANYTIDTLLKYVNAIGVEITVSVPSST